MYQYQNHANLLIFRSRAFSDLEAQMNLLQPEYQNIKEATSKLSLHPMDEMVTLWEETERVVAEK